VEIDAALLGGDLTRIVAERFDGLSYPQVKGHRRSAHHLRRSPLQRDSRQPHDADSLLKRIESNLGDPDALAALRVAVSALDRDAKRLFIAELRRRSGKGAEHVPVARRAA
jgi:hypothetical protein